jgi:hypothetical protein
MSADTGSDNKKVKMDGMDAVEASEQPPVAGPSSERLDHAQNGRGKKDINDNKQAEDDSDDGSDANQDSDDDDEDLSGISEGSVSGEDEEDDYEDILQANEDAQSGKKKSACFLFNRSEYLLTISPQNESAPSPRKLSAPCYPPSSLHHSLQKPFDLCIHPPLQKHWNDELAVLFTRKSTRGKSEVTSRMSSQAGRPALTSHSQNGQA